MFAIALIAGQAHANLPAEASATADFGSSAGTGIILDAKSLRKIQSLPYVVDIFLALPIDIGTKIDDLTISAGTTEDAGSDDMSGR